MHNSGNRELKKLRRTEEVVRDLRSAVGDTQQQFANRLGFAISSIVRYEAGKPVSEQALIKMTRLASSIEREDLATELADRYFQSFLEASEQIPTWERVLTSIVSRVLPSTASPEDVDFVVEKTTVSRLARQFDEMHRLESDLLHKALPFLIELGAELRKIRRGLQTTGDSTAALKELGEVCERLEQRIKADLDRVSIGQSEIGKLAGFKFEEGQSHNERNDTPPAAQEGKAAVPDSGSHRKGREREATADREDVRHQGRGGKGA